MAVILMAAGLIGIFLPFIPGLLLIFLGAAVFLEKDPKVLFREIKDKLKAKYQEEYALDCPEGETDGK